MIIFIEEWQVNRGESSEIKYSIPQKATSTAIVISMLSGALTFLTGPSD